MAGPSSSKRRIVDGEYFQNYGGMEQCYNVSISGVVLFYHQHFQKIIFKIGSNDSFAQVVPFNANSFISEWKNSVSGIFSHLLRTFLHPKSNIVQRFLEIPTNTSTCHKIFMVQKIQNVFADEKQSRISKYLLHYSAKV